MDDLAASWPQSAAALDPAARVSRLAAGLGRGLRGAAAAVRAMTIPPPTAPDRAATAAAVPTGTAEQDRRDVAVVLAGDADAFAALVDRHQGRILGHLARLVGRDDAEDLAQETFVRAYQALPRYDATYPFRGWLLVIASRLAANHAARRRERTLGDALADHPAAPAGHGRHDPAQRFAEDDAAADLVRRLDQALATLSPDARALYELRFRQELPIEELANHFAISENALKVRIHRLRAQLASQLGLAPAATTE
jgi:RNA polymerase sigma-70 factor (ECF subfamily)